MQPPSVLHRVVNYMVTLIGALNDLFTTISKWEWTTVTFREYQQMHQWYDVDFSKVMVILLLILGSCFMVKTTNFILYQGITENEQEGQYNYPQRTCRDICTVVTPIWYNISTPQFLNRWLVQKSKWRTLKPRKQKKLLPSHTYCWRYDKGGIWNRHTYFSKSLIQ